MFYTILDFPHGKIFLAKSEKGLSFASSLRNPKQSQSLLSSRVRNFTGKKNSLDDISRGRKRTSPPFLLTSFLELPIREKYGWRQEKFPTGKRTPINLSPRK
jgi:hypothetical protein